MSVDGAETERLVRRTLAHYDAHAEAFWEGTRLHDVAENRDALLDALAGTPPFSILDVGCGPGRDLAAFRAAGHEAVGLDGSAQFVLMARRHSAAEVWQQSFLALDLPPARFDGVFANASLFHVPKQDLPRVLAVLFAAIRPGGALFSSNPHGNDEESFHGERFGVHHSPARWNAHVGAAGFSLLREWFRPRTLPAELRTWHATLWRRP